MTRDEALKKIKKCLAVARSTSPEEAAIALGQAQKLMAAFNVSEREMSLVDVTEAAGKASTTAVNLWEVALAGLVAQAFGCERFARASARLTSSWEVVRERHYVFVGMDAAPTVAAYAFEVLTRQCARDRAAHIRKQPRNCKPATKSARGDEFAMGWVHAVMLLVERFAQPARDHQLLLAYMADKHPDLADAKVRDATAGRRTDSGHRSAGYAAGKNARLERGVGGMAPQERLT